MCCRVYTSDSPWYTLILLMVKPNPLAPFLTISGGLRLLANGEISREGDPSLELVLDPPGEVTGGIIKSSENQNADL